MSVRPVTYAQPAVTYAAPATTATPLSSVRYAAPAASYAVRPTASLVSSRAAVPVAAAPVTTVQAASPVPVVAQRPAVTYASPPSTPSINTAVYARTAQASPWLPTSQKQVIDSSDNNLWGGGCAWQYDKTAFKNWVLKAVDQPASKDRKELYGYLAECFLDADGDRDGLIAQEEFDFLIEKAATMPRRFGLAPNWVECYGDISHRTQARNQMFQQMDKLKRGKIGLEEWIEFSMEHIAQKVRAINWQTLDFAHLEKSGPSAFVKFLEEALADKHTEQYKSLYMHLFKTFVESDVDEKGAVTFEQFDILIEDAAQAPRVLGLAPLTQNAYPTSEAKLQARRAEFDQMDTDKQGTVTFDEFFQWCLNHIYSKVQEYRANGGR